MNAMRPSTGRTAGACIVATLGVIALVLCACPANRSFETGPEQELPHGSTDTGAAVDAGLGDAGVVPDAGQPSKSFVYRPVEGDPGESEVRIVSGFVSGDTFTIQLGTGGFSDLYGMYFRPLARIARALSW